MIAKRVNCGAGYCLEGYRVYHLMGQRSTSSKTWCEDFAINLWHYIVSYDCIHMCILRTVRIKEAITCTILPEIFSRVLFSLYFAVGAGPRKLSARIFLHTRKFLPPGVYYHLHAVRFPRRCRTITLFIFLLSRQAPADVSLSIHAAKRQGPKWACLTYCMHAESSYLTAKLASSQLPFRRAISL